MFKQESINAIKQKYRRFVKANAPPEKSIDELIDDQKRSNASLSRQIRELEEADKKSESKNEKKQGQKEYLDKLVESNPEFKLYDLKEKQKAVLKKTEKGLTTKIIRDRLKEIENTKPKDKKEKKALEDETENLKSNLKKTKELDMIKSITDLYPDSEMSIADIILDLTRGMGASASSERIRELQEQYDLGQKKTEELYKRKESESTMDSLAGDKETDVLNPNWFKFENYLFDANFWEIFSFCIKCNIVWDKLLCACTKMSSVNNIFMEYVLELIRKIEIPSTISNYTKSFRDIAILLTYLDNYPRSDCILELRDSLVEYFKTEKLDSYVDDKLLVLDTVQKLWFYLNYKVNTRVSNINTQLASGSNEWDKFPLEITNKLDELELEKTITQLLDINKRIVDGEYNNIDLMLELLEKTYDLFIVDKYNNLYVWVLISNIIRFPLYFKDDYPPEINFKLCKLYTNWFRICSITEKVHIYKYSYFLAINNIVNKLGLDISSGNKNSLLREFYNDINITPISEKQYNKDIESIRDNILKTENVLWYNSNDEYNNITTHILGLVNNNLSIVFSNINASLRHNLIKSSGCEKLSLLENPIINTSIKKDDKVILNPWKTKYDNNLINCLFPNLTEYTEDNASYKLNILLSLVQMAHSCKIEKKGISIYPFIIPQLAYDKNQTLTISSNDTTTIENNILYKINESVELSPKNISPTENINTPFNLTSGDAYSYYLNNFIGFVQSEDPNYLKYDSDFLPFVKYGYNINDNYRPIPIKYDESIEKINNDSLYTKNNLLENLINGNSDKLKAVFEKIKTDVILVDPLEYNICLFVFSFLNKDVSTDIKEKQLFTIEQLKSPKISKINKLMGASNCIKYYLGKDNAKAYEYINYLNNLVNKVSINTSTINIQCENSAPKDIEEKYFILTPTTEKTPIKKSLIISKTNEIKEDINNYTVAQLLELITNDNNKNHLPTEYPEAVQSISELIKEKPDAKINDFWLIDEKKGTFKHTFIKISYDYKNEEEEVENKNDRIIQNLILEHVSIYIINNSPYIKYFGKLDNYTTNTKVNDETVINLQPLDTFKLVEVNKTNKFYIKAQYLFNYYDADTDPNNPNSIVKLMNKKYKDSGNKFITEKSGNTISFKHTIDNTLRDFYQYTKNVYEEKEKKNEVTGLTIKYEVHENIFGSRIYNYEEIKSIIFDKKGAKTIYSNNSSFMDNYYSGVVVENKIKFTSPYFITNSVITQNFTWTSEDNKLVGKSKNTYPEYDIFIDVSQSKYVLSNSLGENFVSIDNALLKAQQNTQSKFLEKIMKMVSDRNNNVNMDDILLWEKDNKITRIDFYNYKTNLVFRDKHWYINDTYRIVDNNTEINGKKIKYMPEILRWVSDINNFWLTIDNNKDLFIYILPFYNNHKSICNEQQMPNIEKALFGQIGSRMDELFKTKPYYSLKLNATTYFPVIKDSLTLEILCLNYLYSQNLSNIFDLWSLVRKFDLDLGQYFHLFSDTNNQSMKKYFSFRIPSVDTEKIIKNKMKYSQYEINYTIYDESLVNNYTKSYELNYHFPPLFSEIMPSLTEYWLYSLLNTNEIVDMKISNLSFSLYYHKMLNRYKAINKNGIFTKLIDEYSSKKEYTTNSLEFFYQYILGYFAKEEQKKLIDDITSDINSNKPMTGGYRSLIKYFINELNYGENKTQSHIHSLIMGGGKTSMITPLVIIRYLQQNGFYNSPDDKLNTKGFNIYLVLPEPLVIQSFENLSNILNLYFPINVKILKESRAPVSEYGKYSDSVAKINPDELQLYILSDTTMKSGFLNNYTAITANSQKHVYLYDEADTLIDPIVSELNYPIGDKIKLANIEDYFGVLYQIINSIYKDNDELKGLLSGYVDKYESAPHFNIIDDDPPMLKVIRDYAINKIIENYPDNQLIRKIFSNTDDKEVISNIVAMCKDENNIPLLYTLFNFLNEILPSIVTKINRKNYGLVNKEIPDDKKELINLTIVPFSYAETPKIGSLFSNPLLTMCLTIVDYIVQIQPLNDYVLKNLLSEIINEYNGIELTKRAGSPLVKNFNELGLSVSINELTNLEQLNKGDIDKLRSSDYFIKMICLKACKTITFNLNQYNIAGIDLFMNMNINKKSGFTGTPNIPEFHDLEPENRVIVNPIDPDSSLLVRSAFAKSSIYINNVQDSQIKYVEDVIKNNLNNGELNGPNSCNTLIDIGAICIGITAEQIYELVIKHKKGIKQFIYWDSDDIAYCINNAGKSRWNGMVGTREEMFYYYDNKHTTGIDAQIPLESVGLALIGKNSRYRDVSQGIYRMRKLNTENGHTIRFVINNKLYQYVKELLKISTEITIENLVNWFNLEEENFLKKQTSIMEIQNIRALRRYFPKTKTEDENPFYIDNSFKYPTVDKYDKETIAKIIMGLTSYNNLEIMAKIQEIENSSEYRDGKIDSTIISYLSSIKSSVSQKLITNTDNTSVQQTEAQTQVQTQTQTTLQNVKENVNNSVPAIVESLSTLNNFDDYYRDSTYYKKLYDSEDIKGYYSSNLQFYKEGPYMILYKNNNYFIVPMIEGIKLMEYVLLTEDIDKTDVIIYDTTQVVYFNSGGENSGLKVSIGKVIFKKIFDAIFIDDNDYLNISKLKNESLNEYISNTETQTKKYAQFINIVKVLNDVLGNEQNVRIISDYNKENTERGKKQIYGTTTGNLRAVFKFYTNNGNYLDDINMVDGMRGGGNKYYEKYLKYKAKYLKLKTNLKF